MEILQDSLPPALGPEVQLPGQDYQPKAGAAAAPAAPLVSWSNWGMARLSQQEGLYALLSCSYLQRASVHSTLANIRPNVQSYT